MLYQRYLGSKVFLKFPCNIVLHCSQLSIISYFHTIVERADRIARELDDSAKRKT